ncbi:MAG: CotH kinase family protein [Bacteroidaceae bacterium]|nr:CotH kinase family protein [Bacteroidaceae bacterium]
MKRHLILSSFLLFSVLAASAQGIRIYKTDGTQTDVPISNIDRIECMENMKFDHIDYSREVLSMHVTRLSYTIPGDREPREAVSVTLLSGESGEVLTTEGGIRVRGNSTSTLEKKPWDLKLNAKTSLLGMPKDKRWVLLANYWDRTNLRNDVGLEIARRAKGMAWNPRSQYVQLYMDGKYEGLYLLCEKIKSAKDRVNITELDVTANKEPEVTGGYILEFDYTHDEKTYQTSTMGYDFKIKEPDVPTKEQEEHVLNYLNTMEKVLRDPMQVKQQGYTKFLDTRSFIDFWLVGELVMNKDFNGPASCYMYKDRGGVLMAGPVWDLDLYTFSAKVHDVNQFLLKGSCLYYRELFTDPAFVKQAKERWQQFKASLVEGYSIYDYIDDRCQLISAEVEADDTRYPNRKYGNTLAGDEKVGHAESVSMMKSFLTARIAALDKLISAL